MAAVPRRLQPAQALPDPQQFLSVQRRIWAWYTPFMDRVSAAVSNPQMDRTESNNMS